MASLKAEALGDLRVAGVRSTACRGRSRRHVRRGHMESIEQLLRVRIAIEIDVVERMAVAREEFLDAQRPGAVRRAEHDDVADIRAMSSSRRRMNDRIRISLNSASVWHERQQLLASELDDFTRLAHLYPRHRPDAL
jgi:hypothetical protein